MTDQADLLHLTLGIATELGAALDVVKRMLPHCTDPYLAQLARDLLARNDEVTA